MVPAKLAIIDSLCLQIKEELIEVTRQAREAAEAVTHEDNRQEGDKDMRSTEASYVARGQAERVVELERELARLRTMPCLEFTGGDAIAASALVALQTEDGVHNYFLVTVGGGRRVAVDGCEVRTLASSSPLGAALMGLSRGDEAEVPAPQGERLLEILDVS